MHIDIQAISKTFGTFTALDDVSLRIDSGELVALLGPSGSGKTTLLRIIAGLEHPDVGRVCFNGDDASARSLRERRVGFVFQHYALFRHLSVFENVAFGLRVRRRSARPPEAEIQRRVTQLLELVQLAGLGNRLPTQLSGGQRQRVALARALAVEPQVLLLDEPFGALDAKVRRELRRWLRRLHDDLGITSIFVTHDQEEALELADRVVIMNHGRVEQEGTPDDVYAGPGSAFVYHFLGDTNHIPGEGRGGQVFIGGLPLDAGVPADGPVDVFVRPHGVMVNAFAAHGVPSRVRAMSAAGPLVRVELDADGLGTIRGEITHDRARYLGVGVGLPFRVWFDPGQVFVAVGAGPRFLENPFDEREADGVAHPVMRMSPLAPEGRALPMFGKVKVS